MCHCRHTIGAAAQHRRVVNVATTAGRQRAYGAGRYLSNGFLSNFERAGTTDVPRTIHLATVNCKRGDGEWLAGDDADVDGGYRTS